MNFIELRDRWLSTTPYFTVHTSGSTGQPKSIRLSKSVMRQSAERTNAFFDIDSHSTIHSELSLQHIGGIMAPVRAFVANCRFFMPETPTNRPFIPPLTHSDGFHDYIDLLSVVPTQMHYIAENKEQYPVVKNFLVGGAPLTQSQHEAIVHSKLSVWESYGMTETASHIALRKVGSLSKGFQTLPGIDIELDDRDCLVIRGVTRQPVITNDVCDILGPGRFVVVGRVDNVINTGGKKVHPEALEQKIQKILRKSCLKNEVMVTSAPDEKWGQRVVLLIEDMILARAEIKVKNKTIRNIEGLLRQNLEGWENPKEIRIINRLPRTSNGKLIRH